MSYISTIGSQKQHHELNDVLNIRTATTHNIDGVSMPVHTTTNDFRKVYHNQYGVKLLCEKLIQEAIMDEIKQFSEQRMWAPEQKNEVRHRKKPTIVWAK